MNILPVVVLYNVDFRRTNAYRTLLYAYKGRILLYENSPEPMNRAYMSQTVLYRHDATNGGVSAAYNYAAMMAKRMGQVDALLLLDEDTSFERDYLQTLQQAMTDRPAVSLFVPQVVYRVNRPFSPIVRSVLRWHRGAKLAPGVYSLNRYLPVNSGACIRLAAFERVRGYNSDIRLDFADFDFFSRLAAFTDQFCVVKSTAAQQFSNEQTDRERLLARFRFYIEGAHVARRNELISVMVWIEVFRHTMALSLRTFSWRFISEWFRHF